MRCLWGFVVGIALAGTLTSCASAHRHPTLTVGPASALYDTPLAVTIGGLTPGHNVTLALHTTSSTDVAWSSSATFTADAHGQVTLNSPAVSGSYTGPSPSGLVDTLFPADGGRETFVASSPFRLTFAATSDGHPVGTDTVTRVFPHDVGVAVTSLSLPSTGLFGELALPKNTARPGPAVVIWGGSEVGLSTNYAVELLAAHGYPALALAYFGEPGLPATLSRVPLEYFASAVRYLDRQKAVDLARVAV